MYVRTYAWGVIPLSPCTHLYTFWMTPPSFPQLRKHLMDGLPLNHKTNENIRISYSLEYKHSKKEFYKKIYDSVGWNKHSGEHINQNPIVQCQLYFVWGLIL